MYFRDRAHGRQGSPRQVPQADFTETMTQDTFVEQMARIQATREEDLDYWGLGVFGPRQAVDPITRKFSLWRI